MGTWIVGAVVVWVIGLAAYKVYKDRQSGKGCGPGCESYSCCPGCKEPNSTKLP